MMQTEKGFSLVELLVALVILAVGILGIAGLQIVSLQQNRGALMRDQALWIGNSILERMRANPDADYSGVAFADPPSAPKDCRDVPCNPTEMAAFDIAQWKCSISSFDDVGNAIALCQDYGIAGNLPQGEGAIELNGSVHEVMIRWQDRPDGSTFDITLRTRTE